MFLVLKAPGKYWLIVMNFPSLWDSQLEFWLNQNFWLNLFIHCCTRKSASSAFTATKRMLTLNQVGLNKCSLCTKAAHSATCQVGHFWSLSISVFTGAVLVAAVLLPLYSLQSEHQLLSEAGGLCHCWSTCGKQNAYSIFAWLQTSLCSSLHCPVGLGKKALFL